MSPSAFGHGPFTGPFYNAIIDPVKQQKCRQYIDTIVAQNRYGSASSLGGLSRLRTYPLGRYSGAHSQFIGTEVRWNLTDEKTPFDIFIVKDIRTAFQVALFYELGTVANSGRRRAHPTARVFASSPPRASSTGLISPPARKASRAASSSSTPGSSDAS